MADQPFSVAPTDIGGSGITRWLTSDTTTWRSAVELTHPHYEKLGVSVHRSIVQLQSHAYAVEDMAAGGEGLSAQQLFHLAPDAEANVEPSGTLRVSWPSHDVRLWLRSDATEYAQFEGETDPVQGWFFPSDILEVAAPTLAFPLALTEGEATIRTLIAATKGDEEPQWAPADDATDEALSCLRQVEQRELLPNLPPT